MRKREPGWPHYDLDEVNREADRRAEGYREILDGLELQGHAPPAALTRQKQRKRPTNQRLLRVDTMIRAAQTHVRDADVTGSS